MINKTDPGYESFRQQNYDLLEAGPAAFQRVNYRLVAENESGSLDRIDGDGEPKLIMYGSKAI